MRPRVAAYSRSTHSAYRPSMTSQACAPAWPSDPCRGSSRYSRQRVSGPAATASGAACARRIANRASTSTQTPGASAASPAATAARRLATAGQGAGSALAPDRLDPGELVLRHARAATGPTALRRPGRTAGPGPPRRAGSARAGSRSGGPGRRPAAASATRTPRWARLRHGSPSGRRSSPRRPGRLRPAGPSRPAAAWWPRRSAAARRRPARGRRRGSTARPDRCRGCGPGRGERPTTRSRAGPDPLPLAARRPVTGDADSALGHQQTLAAPAEPLVGASPEKAPGKRANVSL